MSPIEAQWFQRWHQSHYDPRTRKVVIVGPAPAYVVEHEKAHAAQHAEGSVLWLMWRGSRWIPFFREAVRLALELDADRRAKRALRAAGMWNERNAKAARLVMGTYHMDLPQLAR